jgi:hypothetical protein
VVPLLTVFTDSFTLSLSDRLMLHNLRLIKSRNCGFQSPAWPLAKRVHSLSRPRSPQRRLASLPRQPHPLARVQSSPPSSPSLESGAINPLSHVFDAEAIGAWKGLQRTTRLPPDVRQRRLWMCIDSTSVIWCIRGNASSSSQWAFHNCQDVMQSHDVRVCWAPGHTGIEGNEAADKLADLGAATEEWDAAMASEPTISGIRSVFRTLRKGAQSQWWAARAAKLSTWYKKWGLSYKVKPLPELDLPRSTLHHLLALRTSHGDFS